MINQLKRITTLLLLFCFVFAAQAQEKNDKKAEKREKLNAQLKQEEEGVLVYTKQSLFGLELRTNGYGAFYELGRRRSTKATTTYSLELSEIKSSKEEKGSGTNFFANTFVYGKINNFYQAKLGYGQQIILGQKGNKNGVAVTAHFQGGLALGLLKPYYVDALDGFGQNRAVKYDSPDSTLFLSGPITGGSGFTVGWNEVKMKPGAFLKTAQRFDFGRFNESVQALEIGMSVDAYADKIPIMVYSDPKQLFFQGHLAFVFGRRR